jgi:hypothetical protein
MRYMLVVRYIARSEVPAVKKQFSLLALPQNAVVP